MNSLQKFLPLVCCSVLGLFTACTNPLGGNGSIDNLAGGGGATDQIADKDWVFLSSTATSSPDAPIGAGSTFTYKVASPTLKALDNGGFQLKSNGEMISYSLASPNPSTKPVIVQYTGGSWTRLDPKRIAVAERYWEQGSFLRDTLEIVSETATDIVVRRATLR